MAEPVIETRALRRVFRTRQGEVKAVDGVDLSVAPGEIFGFLGPNGAGKTTTLRMLATLLAIGSGEARVVGFDLRREPARVREKIGYVAQGGATDPTVPGREELVLQGRLYGQSGAEATRRATALIDQFELAACAERPVGTFSGGQKRRLDLALGLIHEPSLVFLDEPTTGLDPQARAHVWDEVRRIRDRGTTVFLTTHYLDEADALCDRLAIIDHGRIVAEGTAASLKRQIAGDIVLVGADGTHDRVEALLHGEPFVREISREGTLVRLAVDHGESAMPSILRILDGAGIRVETLSLHRPSLDDVFLRQTGRSLREVT